VDRTKAPLSKPGSSIVQHTAVSNRPTINDQNIIIAEDKNSTHPLHFFYLLLQQLMISATTMIRWSTSNIKLYNEWPLKKLYNGIMDVASNLDSPLPIEFLYYHFIVDNI
jgi:hypothetical protein